MEFTLEEISKLTGSKLQGNPLSRVTNVADLESASESDISFLGNPRYEGAMKKSKAGAIFIQPHYAESAAIKDLACAFLFHEEPSRAFQTLIELFVPDAKTFTGFTGIHPSATLHPTATIEENVSIGPGAVIDAHVRIQKNTVIGALVYIGPYVEIGQSCHIMPHAVLRERTHLGNRVIIQPGAVLGSCGFGYTQDKEGRHIKLNQVGTVVIEDDVEIGANTTLDRSRFKETRISRGTKIDNLVQIGHGVTLGSDNIIISQAGIAGSSSTGKHVIIAGQAAVAGHIHITDGVMLAAKSGISKSITKPGKYNGIPAVPLDEYNRNTVYLRRIEDMAKSIKLLQAELKRLKT